MNLLLYAFWTAHLLACRQAPAGTELHIRLTNAVGSYASRTGSPVHAVLISPVIVDGETVLPMGAVIDGEVSAVKRVGFGIVHETASLAMNFDRVTLPGGEQIRLAARVTQVDNARERVSRDGVIRGVRATGSLCYRASGYIQAALEWEIHAELAEWFFRALIIQLPEPEIYYPAGVELSLRLTKALVVSAPESQQWTLPSFTSVERDDLEPLVEQLPLRTEAVSGRPSDLINVMFIGSRQQLATAFAAAGWAEPQPVSMRARIRDIRAVAERAGYGRAPMSALLLNHAEPDMAWEKGLNDLSKRHHIRMWKQQKTWQGKEVWVGAATRDLDFAFFRPGQMMTHRVERNIDDERDKVADDLLFTSCVDAADWLDRDGAPREIRNSTGDPMSTDARLAVLRLTDCTPPRFSASSAPALPAHGSRMQRFARREILSMRSDLVRTNTYYRVYEAARLAVEAVVRHYRNRADGGLAMLSSSRAVGRGMRRTTAPMSTRTQSTTLLRMR